jgi:hypothetical protein
MSIPDSFFTRFDDDLDAPQMGRKRLARPRRTTPLAGPLGSLEFGLDRAEPGLGFPLAGPAGGSSSRQHASVSQFTLASAHWR